MKRNLSDASGTHNDPVDDGDKKPAAKKIRDEVAAFSWIKEGKELLAVHPEGYPAKARAVSNPCQIDHETVVLIEWDAESRVESVVKCCCCSPLHNPTRVPNTAPPHKILSANQFKEPPEGTKELASSGEKENSNSDGPWAQSAHVTDSNEHAAAREKAITNLQLLSSQKYSLELINFAIEKVGYPYGLQDILREVQIEWDHAQLVGKFSKCEEELESFKVKKGMQIRQYWYDGKAYDGYVKTGKPETDFVEGKKEQVYEIEYDDGTKDLMTKQELRMHRHPKPEMPKILGRKFHFLELFSGAYQLHEDRCCNELSICPLTSASLLHMLRKRSGLQRICRSWL